jgi:hypothetical protein
MISVASTDLVAFDFKSVANIAHAWNATKIVMLGVHTNMCIRSVAMYCSWIGIKSVYVDDLLDSAYYYPGQRTRGVDCHSKMNKIVFRYAMEYHGKVVKTYDLIRSLKKAPATIGEPSWVLFSDQAIPYMRLYA